ncbi:MAG: branched-chain amino acid ABC transporter permease [Thermoanaerobacteraceae bacterium]|nr:branched-chain amino acid ABC transporter permease [Thermoanaerobacteraceae bacterium]
MGKIFDTIKNNILIVIALLLALIPVIGVPSYQFYIIERGLQNAIIVISLVILLGYTGQLSLGHAGLLATGAYTYGILVVSYNVNPWIAFLIAPIFTALIGALLGIPSFKLTGPFLVVTTIALGEIVRILILNWEKLTGGPYGLTGITSIISNSKLMFYLILIIVYFISVATSRLSVSKIGLAFKAIKEDEVAAEVMGVDVKRYKLLAFTISSFLAGLSGAIFASLTGYLNPDSFTFADSATFLLMTVLGGMSSVPGAILSSLAVTALPEILRFMARSRMVIYSLVLLLIIRYSKQLSSVKISKFFLKKKNKEDLVVGGGE